MSHFTVMLISDERPTDDVITKALLPWHEFECTGLDNEFVQAVDKTAEMRAEYETDTTRRLRAADGTLFSPYDDEFYREPTSEELRKIGPVAGTGGGHGLSWHSRDWGDGRGYRTKIRYTPEGLEDVEVPYREAMTFREFVAYQTSEDNEVPFGQEPDLTEDHKHGFTLLTPDGDVYKVIRRTNPNAKWDWWTVGGRWSGKLAAGHDPHTDPANFERCFLCNGTGRRADMECRDGCNGCSGTGRMLKHAPKWRDCGNVAQAKDISFDKIRDAGGQKFGAIWDKRRAAVGDHEIPDFEALREKHGIEVARDLYWNSPAMKALSEAGESFLDREDIDLLRGPREAAVEAGRFDALSTFAFVKDGQWHERGEMGWFACVHDEKDKAAWQREFNAMLDTLPPEAWVAIIDCHI